MVNIAESKNTSQTISVDEVMKKNHSAYVLLSLIVRRSGKSTNEEHLEVPEVEMRDYLDWGFTRGKFRAALSFLERHGLIRIRKQSTKPEPTARTTLSPKISLSSTEAYNRLSYVEKLTCNPFYDHATHLSLFSSSSPPSSFSLSSPSPVTSSPPISISLSSPLPPQHPLFCATGKPSEAQKKKNFSKSGIDGKKAYLPFQIHFNYEHYTFAGLDDDGILGLEERFPTKDVKFELWRMIGYFTRINDRKKHGGINFILNWLRDAATPNIDIVTSEGYVDAGFQDEMDYHQYQDERAKFYAARYQDNTPKPEVQMTKTEKQKAEDEEWLAILRERDEREALLMAELPCFN